MKTSVASVLVGLAVLLLLVGAVAAPASAQTPVTACGTLTGQTSYRLDADLASTGTCLTISGNGVTLNLNGHSIRGTTGSLAGIIGTGNNIAIWGPGIVHDFDSCISLNGNHQLVQNVLAYNCQTVGIWLGNFSKCVECRVHDVLSSEGTGIGIVMGAGAPPSIIGNVPCLLCGQFAATGGCLLESSIVESSDWGAVVGRDCKVWDLVIDTVGERGLRVGRGTSVARTVISHYHNGPGLDYTDCITLTTDLTANGCQDSSNSVTLTDGVAGIAESIRVGAGSVVTDCATNDAGVKFKPPLPAGNCS